MFIELLMNYCCIYRGANDLAGMGRYRNWFGDSSNHNIPLL